MQRVGRRQTRRQGFEALETRQLLAGDLTGQWVADDLDATLAGGEAISAWSDALSGIPATATGQPRLVRDVFDGHSAVRFNRFDNVDFLTVDAADSPMSGVDNFSIALVFATNSNALNGGNSVWFLNTGLVDGTGFFGTTADWGLVINSAGQLGAGLGGPPTSLYSDLDQYNDGETHVAVYTRSGSDLSLYVDSLLAGQRNDASPGPRNNDSMTFGALNGGALGFTGDFAEIRTYDGELTPQEVADLSIDLLRTYTYVLPLALPDRYATDEDLPLIVDAAQGVLRNDVNHEPDPMVAILQIEPQHGELALAADGSFTYTPDAHYSGPDSFTYLARTQGDSRTVSVDLDVAPIFDIPIALDDHYLVESTALFPASAANGVLANEYNPDGEPLTATLVEDVTNGQLTLAADGSFQYDPEGHSGTVSFRYELSDSRASRNTATVTLLVDHTPVAAPDAYELEEAQQFHVAAGDGVLANDTDFENDPLTTVLVAQPNHGAVELAADESFIYFPPIDFAGIDEFSYRVNDGDQTSVLPATVRLNVSNVNDAPQATADRYLAFVGAALDVAAAEGVLVNDTDVDGPTLTATVLQPPQLGTLDFQPDGSFRYLPAAGFLGNDAFTYRLSDGTLESQPARVEIAVRERQLLLTEVMAGNVTLETRTQSDTNGDFIGEPVTPDWFEIANTTALTIDLGGHTVTDDPNAPAKWRIPDGTFVPANGHLVLFASGRDLKDTASDELGLLHTSFGIDSAGEYLGLYDPAGQLVDEFAPTLPVQAIGVSYGRLGQSYRWFATPTPGAAANPVSEPRLGVVAPVQANVQGGFYSGATPIALESATAGTTIYYTLDGAMPTPEIGLMYSGPFFLSTTTAVRARAFKPDWVASSVNTQSYLYLDDVLSQSDLPAGFPNTWAPATNEVDYGVDPRVATDPTSEFYSPLIREALQTHPTISIVTDIDHLFDTATGLYTNPQQDGVEWERPVSMEFITADGVRRVQANAGLRMQGNASRSPNREKHNMRLLFKEIYGDSKLEFPLFEDIDVTRFDTIILRGQNGDSWFHPNAGQRTQAQYNRDQWARDTQVAMGRTTVAQRHVHLYLNGLYWGLYHIFEKPNASYFAEHFGGEPEDYDVLQHRDGTVDGNRDAWNALMAMARAGTEDPAVYDQISQQVDIPSFIDYFQLNFYSANTDWDQNNWFGGRRRTGGDDPGGKWIFFTWDAERTFVNPATDRTGVRNVNQPSELHQLLTENAEYRQQFADQAQRNFFHGGPLTQEAAEARWLTRVAEIEVALWAESARWGDAKRANQPYTPDAEWRAETERLQELWFATRTETVLEQLRGRGLYPMVAAPTLSQHGGAIEGQFELGVTAPQGAIYVTSDGSDPRLVGGRVAPTAELLERTVTVRPGSQLQARALHEGEWSALVDVTFQVPTVPADASNLRIAEVHYHPADPDAAETAAGFSDADDFEFLELVNISAEHIDLSGVQLVQQQLGSATQGVAFDFQQGNHTRLAPGERLLVVENLDAFAARYGDSLPVAGAWSGGLANNRERITLQTGDTLIQQFSYDDTWFPTTDGQGPSLEVEDATADLSQWQLASGWQASGPLGGTPGSGNLPGDFNGDAQVNQQDIDVLQAALRNFSHPLSLDLTDDGQLAQDDLAELVGNILGTRIGDANLDGDVDAQQPDGAGDGQLLLASLGDPTARGWARGDFDGDNRVTASRDGALLLAALAADSTADVIAQPLNELLANAEGSQQPTRNSTWDGEPPAQP